MGKFPDRELYHVGTWNNSTGRPCWPRSLKKDGSVNLSWSLASLCCDIKTAGSFFFPNYLNDFELCACILLPFLPQYCTLWGFFCQTEMKWAVHHAMQRPGSRVWFSALYFCHVHDNESAIHPAPFKSSLGPIFHLHGVPQFVSA